MDFGTLSSRNVKFALSMLIYLWGVSRALCKYIKPERRIAFGFFRDTAK
jgi:hypothetical protein